MLTCAVSGSIGDVKYTWYKDDEVVSGENGQTYALTGVKGNRTFSGKYKCKADTTIADETSNAVNVTFLCK